jgi:hypothetical protein
VTPLAPIAQSAIVRIVTGMARKADGRCANKDLVLVASPAIDVNVGAGQRKGGQGVINGGLIPIVRRVTLVAPLAQAAVVRIIIPVAHKALSRRTHEDLILVTPLAIDVDMGAGQRKGGQGVIDAGVPPARWRVTRLASLAQPAVVRIIIAVARKALGRRADQDLVLVTPPTIDVDVGAGQGEFGQGVVDGHLPPARRSVARLASLAQPAVVRIVFGMTHGAIRRRLAEIGCRSGS